MNNTFGKTILLLLGITLFPSTFANTLQPLTQTVITYQSDGDPASRTLSWADGRQVFQLNNIKQQTTRVFYSQAASTSPCKTELPTALTLPTADLTCASQTSYKFTSTNGPVTPITSLAYIDSRTGEVVAKVDPMGNATGYHYDQLGRTTAITYHYNLAQANRIKATISYLNADNTANQTGYNQVIITRPDGIKQRTLTNGLDQVVEKQVNSCPDGASSIAGCTPGALLTNDQFRTLSSASYTHNGILQSQAQRRTDALGATTDYQYDALGRQIGVTTTQQSAITDNSPVTVTRGVIYDQVNRLQVSYQQVASSVSPGDAHVVKVKYFNDSGKVIHTVLISIDQLQQTTGEPANLLFTSGQTTLLSCLVGIKNHSGPCAQIKSWVKTTRYNGLLQKQQQQNALQQMSYQYNNRALPATTTIQALGAVSHQPAGPQYQDSVQYNLLGKVISHTLKMLASTGSQTGVDNPGNTSRTDAIHSYNSLGELTGLASSQSNPLLSSDFSYNADGQLVSRSNSYGNTDAGATVGTAQITYCQRYNQQGQRVASWDVEQAQADCSQPKAAAQDYKVWTYYQRGNSQGQPAGKLKSIAFNDPHNRDTITYSYYLDGALKQVAYADGLAVHYQYNAANQVIQVSYRQKGTLQNQSYYVYGTGTAHQLLKVTSRTAQVSYQYNDQGNPTVIHRTDGGSLSVTTDKSYNGYDLVASSSLMQNGQLQQQVNNVYTQGQLTQVVVSHPQIAKTNSDYNQFNYAKDYRYDGLNRLVKVTTLALAGNNLKTTQYQFDLNNNITGITTTQYGPTDITSQQQVKRNYNSADQLISQTSNNQATKGYSYGAGNLTKGPKGGIYHYNHLNQLVSYSPPAAHDVTDNDSYYQYYPNGELQSESQGQHTLRFYYSDGQIARVVDNQGNSTSYLGGLTREAVIYHHTGGKNQVEFYAYQGKTPSGWLGQGNTTWQQHNAYGLREAVYHTAGSQPAHALSLVNNPELIGFNGNYQDPISHNVVMGKRVYNPSLGRFLQVDSYDVANRYAYAQDNPIEKYDPSGHMAQWLKDILTFVPFAGIALGIVEHNYVTMAFGLVTTVVSLAGGAILGKLITGGAEAVLNASSEDTLESFLAKIANKPSKYFIDDFSRTLKYLPTDKDGNFDLSELYNTKEGEEGLFQKVAKARQSYMEKNPNSELEEAVQQTKSLTESNEILTEFNKKLTSKGYIEKYLLDSTDKKINGDDEPLAINPKVLKKKLSSWQGNPKQLLRIF